MEYRNCTNSITNADTLSLHSEHSGTRLVKYLAKYQDRACEAVLARIITK